jgi:toxin ParE1/3/4
MSSNCNLRIAHDAEQDLTSTLQHILETWGIPEERIYAEVFHWAFRDIRRFPGRLRPELGVGIRVLSAGQHLILYRELNGVIEVIRVLHSRMDYVDDEW